MNYAEFLHRKSQLDSGDGFDPVFMPDFLFDFQRHLVEWSLRKGRAAIFADCGLGKTPMEFVWAENVVRNTNGNVLIVDTGWPAIPWVGTGGAMGVTAAMYLHRRARGLTGQK